MGLIVSKSIRISISFLVTASLLLISFPPAIAQEDVFPKTADSLFYVPGETVNVTITIDGGTETLSTPVDVMLVMDTSLSMQEPFNGLCVDGFPCKKIKAAQDAMKIFVDNVGENVYVGLVTYEWESFTTLDCGIKPMTDTNKAAIKTAIDSFTEGGSTAIGRGMELGIQELLNEIDPLAAAPCPAPSTSRHNNGEDIRKVMILASDGQYNGGVDPIPTILQRAIDEKITVYTIGIGTNEANVDVVRLKKIACDTDRFDDNICGGADPTNTLASPHNYIFARTTDDLNDFYKDIADEITKPTNYAVIDFLNMTVFDTIVPDSIKVLNCTDGVASGTVWPHQKPFYVPETGPPYSAFFLFMDPIPEQTTVCITLQAHVKDDFSSPFDTILPINSPLDGGWAIILPPDATCTDFASCLDLIDNNINQIKISDGSIIIKNPVKPWLKTTLGDVGSQSVIGPINRDTNSPVTLISADYLLIGNLGINTRFQTQRWRLPNYGLINIDPQPIGDDIYGALQTRYPTCGKLDGSTEKKIKDATSGGCRRVQFNGTFTISSSLDEYDGPPVIIYVNNGDIIINSDLEIDDDTGIIFVTNQNIIINVDSANEIDGIFIANGDFQSGPSNCGTLGTGNQKLTIKGAVYAFGLLCFTRDLYSSGNLDANKNTPAELINFQPRYLYLFQDIIGDDSTIYREVAP